MVIRDQAFLGRQATIKPTLLTKITINAIIKALRVVF
jgi:hypothetical protein